MSQSKHLFATAQQYIPGGVNSPVRAFHGVGGDPLFFKRGDGAYLIDEDDNRYIDYVASWGPLILGHAHPKVVTAIQQAAAAGTSFGTPHAMEVTLAEKICQLMPSIEKIRMVNSGTEATMTAIRLARGVTGKHKILKFEGGYHGHSDSLLVKAGSGALTFGVPSSAGVPPVFAEHTLTATYNDFDSVQKLFAQHRNEIAAIIVEPVAGNMNCVPALPGFLQELRNICDQQKSLLIIDEVITGFRVALGGAQQRFNIKADITTLGKIIGGGLPVGAVGGRCDIMDHLSPTGPVYQAGTLSGNPLAMAAGLAMLNEITQPGFYEQLETNTKQLIEGILERAKAANIPLTANRIGSMFGLFFNDEKSIHNFQQVMQCNIPRFKQFFHKMLAEGIYLAPSAFEAGFVSIMHGAKEIKKTLNVVEKVLSSL